MFLCWVSLCWVSLCWVSLYRVSLGRVSLCWVSLCWVLLCWMSWRQQVRHKICICIFYVRETSVIRQAFRRISSFERSQAGRILCMINDKLQNLCFTTKTWHNCNILCLLFVCFFKTKIKQPFWCGFVSPSKPEAGPKVRLRIENMFIIIPT